MQRFDSERQTKKVRKVLVRKVFAGMVLCVSTVIVNSMAAGVLPVARAAVSRTGATQDKATATVQIDVHQTAQTITGIGGNYPQISYTSSAQDSVGEYTLAHLRPPMVRVPLPLKLWQPTPTSSYQDTGSVTQEFQMLQSMKQKYGVTDFIASVWDAPDWMVSNPSAQQQRIIPHRMYGQVAKAIAAFLTTAKQKYGVDIQEFSFNEANGGYNILFSDNDLIDFIKVAGPLFAKDGLDTKFLIGDTYSTDSLVQYAQPLLADPSIAPYLGPIAYHDWWSTNIPNSDFENIAALAAQYHKPVWCDEVGFDANLWKDPSAFPTWRNAWQTARSLYRALRYSQATATAYWTYQNNFPLLDGTTLMPYPVYDVTKQLSDNLPPGAQMVRANASDWRIWPLAATQPGGGFMAQFMNARHVPVKTTVQGLPAAVFRAWVTTKTGDLIPMGKYHSTNGSVTITLPARSILTLSTRTKP